MNSVTQIDGCDSQIGNVLLSERDAFCYMFCCFNVDIDVQQKIMLIYMLQDKY